MRFLLLATLAFCPLLNAAEDWGALQYLIGTWTAEGAGEPGNGTGTFSFEPDLQGEVLVRKSHAEYPALKDRKPAVHDDLMIVYRELSERAEGALRAIYFDNEGHVIRYRVTMFGDKIVFATDPESGGPQYRFTYTHTSPDTLRLKFEIGSPGKGFTTYLDGAAKRVATPR